MKKEWALRQKWMNPVWYLTDNDMLNRMNRNWESILESGIAGYCKKSISEWKGGHIIITLSENGDIRYQ